MKQKLFSRDKIIAAFPWWPSASSGRKRRGLNAVLAGCVLLAGAWFTSVLEAAEKRIVLVAGRPSHGPGDHEFRAGCLLLKQCLDQVQGITSLVVSNGWPADTKVFENADAIFFYADGGGGHPVFQEQRWELIDRLARKGVGLGFGHYAVEVLKGDPGRFMQDWIGGYYENSFSVNPMWKPEFEQYPDHPVARGLKPYSVVDEWYFNMRWRSDDSGLTHILVAKPSDKVRGGPYVHPQGPYEHIVAARGRDETMMWTYERPEGGRGFGFTGGHKHVNWADDNYRKSVLNALLWIAKAEVPEGGVRSKVSPEDLKKNLDPKKEDDHPNITGAWKVRVESEAGVGTPSFEMIQAGRNLLGKYNGLFGEATVFGSVRNRDVRFSFEAEYEGQEFTVTYAGKLEENDRMKGTVAFGNLGSGSWTAEKGE